MDASFIRTHTNIKVEVIYNFVLLSGDFPLRKPNSYSEELNNYVLLLLSNLNISRGPNETRIDTCPY